MTLQGYLQSLQLVVEAVEVVEVEEVGGDSPVDSEWA